MKRPPAARQTQSGIALVALLVLLIMAGAYAFYRYANVAGGRIQQEAKLAATLARAKEALVARAVTDANRPGSLPCPDLITNSVGLSNLPNDGKADMFTMTQCPSYVGWLPWVTLDLPELLDNTSTRLWYALSPELRDDDSAQPINSDRALTLRLDGAADIAAIIFAPRAPLGAQARPSNNPADYLDGENGNSDDRIYISGPHGPAFNDMVVAITRQELMAAVEKRVASEVKVCLEQHAASTVNTEHTYPWPAPLSNSTFRGTPGSLFGQLPATQPSAGPEYLLKQTTSAVTNAKSALASASTAADQMAALVEVSEAVTVARAFYDKLYAVSSALAVVAGNTQASFVTLGSDIDSAAANGRISRTERTNLRAEAITVQTGLTALQTALVDSGIDPFPGEVLAQNIVFQQKLATATSTPNTANFTALKNQASVLINLFSLSTTPNPDLTTALNNAMNAAAATVVAAGNAAAAPTDATLVVTANTAAQSLVTANNSLGNAITASRVNLHSGDISTLVSQLSNLVSAVATSPNATTIAALANGLAEIQSATNKLVTGSSLVVAARTATLTALSDALGAAQAASDFTLIQSTTNTAIAATSALAAAIANNGDNIARESLTVAANQYLAAQAVFNTVTPPTQAAMLPYVRAVQDPAVDIGFWAQITARSATDIATQARKAPAATSDNTGSAYYAADQALSGISGSGGSQSLLQGYIDAPTNTSKQAAATAALNATLSQVDTQLTSAATLDSMLDSSSAEAFPTLWFGSTCAFLQPPSGSTSWWTANNWANTTFYQISDRIRPASGKLQVNGTGTYRVVALSAGRAIGTQNRATRTTANFLEGINADASRNGDAKTPIVVFSNAPVSGTFNDRLGY